MIKAETLDKLAQTLSDVLPQDLSTVKESLEKNFRAILQSTLNDIDVVSREEFDIQSKVLAKTRAKLEALEKQVSALEK